jgi:hypothetical protein
MEDIEEMDEISILFPQYIELIGYDPAIYRGWTEWK